MDKIENPNFLLTKSIVSWENLSAFFIYYTGSHYFYIYKNPDDIPFALRRKIENQSFENNTF